MGLSLVLFMWAPFPCDRLARGCPLTTRGTKKEVTAKDWIEVKNRPAVCKESSGSGGRESLPEPAYATAGTVPTGSASAEVQHLREVDVDPEPGSVAESNATDAQ